MTTFEIRRGNLLESGADCLVNATNTTGVMGAGIAVQFKARWPEMFADYYRAATDGRTLDVERVHVWENPAYAGGRHGGLLPEPEEHEPRYIVNLHTKDDPQQPSRYLYVVQGLTHLRDMLNDELFDVRTIAVPALGCGLGGLDWVLVEPLTREILEEVGGPGRVDLEVWLYPPRGAAASSEKDDLLRELLGVAEAYRDQQAMPDSRDAARDVVIRRARELLGGPRSWSGFSAQLGPVGPRALLEADPRDICRCPPGLVDPSCSWHGEPE